ncbi:MAG: diguanylate cyclase [Spirochaetes bacterium]|nr:diguanylate cyclase [Spirochaetota bacterium]
MAKIQKKRVLVVDDEYSNIIALMEILELEYDVYAEKNGRDAIEVAEKVMPDVILLDILMPEMNGYETLSRLKNSEKTRGIPVIFITGLCSVDDERKGLIMGAADYITKPFSPAIVELRIKNQIKMLEQLRTIEQISMTDQLTYMPNRRSFDARFNSEWERALREHTPISLLIMDADNFKIYNDTFGHMQGDVALQSFAQVIAGTLKRPGDFAARWGGEEFSVLLPNTDKNGALCVAEQVRKNIEDMIIPSNDEKAAKMTMSIGVNTKTDTESCTIEEFLLRTDKALYDAKKKGRNAVCYFGNDETL